MCFQLVQKSATLVEPELTLNGHYVPSYIMHTSFAVHHRKFNEDRPILSMTEI